ncbi:MAG TPA: hypothetical protein VER96_28260 [Polyangiaceae bacterium]|nr:hypothetical protein [Polyangiaceae bacterium]
MSGLVRWSRVPIVVLAGLVGAAACSGGGANNSPPSSSSGAGGEAKAGGSSGGSSAVGASGGSGGSFVLALGGSPGHAGSSAAGAASTAGNTGSSEIRCYDSSEDTCLCAPNLPAAPPAAEHCGNFDDRYCCKTQGTGTCVCTTWGCTEKDGTCICNSSPQGPSTTSCSPSFSTCCKTPGNPYACGCLNGTCPSGTVQVDGCDISRVGCETGSNPVPSCE